MSGLFLTLKHFVSCFGTLCFTPGNTSCRTGKQLGKRLFLAYLARLYA